MNRRWKKLAVATLSLAGLVVALLTVEHVRGRWMLHRHLATLAANGETVAVDRLVPNPPPADQNSAALLASLSNRLDRVLTNSEAYPPTIRFAAPGRAILTANLHEWGSGETNRHRWSDLEDDLEQAAEVLAVLRSAAERPAYDSGFDYRKGFVDFQLGAVTTVKRCIQLLTVATLHDLKQGDLGHAHANLIALMKLAVNQQPEPLIICQLVRQACVAIAFNVTWQALQQPGWTDAQLAALQSAWAPCDLTGDIGKAFIMERAMALDLYRQVGASRTTLKSVIGQREAPEWSELTGALPTSGFWLHYLHLPVWRVAWIHQDALRMLERWQFMIERERIVRTRSWSALTEPVSDASGDSAPYLDLFEPDESLSLYDRLRFLISSGPFSIGDALLRKTALIQTEQQMVLTAIAAQRHQLRHGSLPGDLQALVPGLLSTLPRDGMDGGALRYRLRPEGGFLLYSVGEDGEDNGGDPTPAKADKPYRSIGDGRDVVWPLPAAEEESKAALEPSKPVLKFRDTWQGHALEFWRDPSEGFAK